MPKAYQLKLDYVKLSNLRDLEFQILLEDLFYEVRKAEESWRTKETVQELLTRLEKWLPIYPQAMHQTTKRPLTEELAKLDKERDQIFNEIRWLHRAYRSRRTEAEQEAYKNFKLLLGALPKALPKKRYTLESSYLSTFFEALDKEPYKTSYQRMGMDDLIEELKTAQQQFEDVLYQRHCMEMEEERYHLRSIRQELTESYLYLCDHLTLMANVYPDSDYYQLFQQLNRSRQQAVDTLRRREAWRKRRAKKKEETDRDKEKGKEKQKDDADNTKD